MIVIAWILNLDADVEFESDSGFRPSANLTRHCQTQGRRFLELANDYAPDGVQHVAAEEASGSRPTLVQSWSPTPGAKARAAELGLDTSPSAPAVDVLRAVNHRSFASRLGPPLPGAGFATTMRELERVLTSRSPTEGWLLKRPFGFSGRGRKRVLWPLDASERRWIEASMHGYGRGLQVEPFVRVVADFAQHGFLLLDGSCICGDATEVSCDEDGAWVASRPMVRDQAARRNLEAAREVAATALVDAGYFGPFSIDGFRWRDDEEEQLRPIGEINARYSMGFFAGLGDRQHEWIRAIRESRVPSG